MIDSGQGTDITVCPDGDERMDADTTRDRHDRLDMSMTTQDSVVGDHDLIAEHAIVSDVHVDHQQVARTDSGDSFLFFATAMDGDPFADYVPVTDFDAGGAAAEGNVLRFATDRRKGMDCIVFAQDGNAEDTDMGDQSRAAADRDIRPDHTVWTDFDVVGDPRAGIDARGVSDYGCHGCLILPPDDFRKSGRASGSPVQRQHTPHSSRAGFTVGRARDAIGFHDHEPKLGLGG